MSMTHFVGKFFSTDDFDNYVHNLDLSDWTPSFVVLHNTGAPTLLQRPNGLTQQHIANLKSYYEGLGWHGGPHLFVDQNGIWVFNDLRFPGVHAPSWNDESWGVEMLGDYTPESFTSGDGAKVHAHAVAALASMHHAAKIDSHSLHLHKDDPNTTHKDCPGSNVIKALMIQDIHNAIVARV